MGRDPLLVWFAKEERILPLNELDQLLAKARDGRLERPRMSLENYARRIEGRESVQAEARRHRKAEAKAEPAVRRKMTASMDPHLVTFRRWRQGTS